MRATHPDREPMTYEEFFRERQNAQYGSGAGSAAEPELLGGSVIERKRRDACRGAFLAEPAARFAVA